MTQCVSDAIAMYTAKVAVGHVASFDPGASQMQMSVAIGPCGSYDPVETPKPLWGSPGAELSTWTTFQFCCETAIHGHALRHGPPELYSYTALYIIQLYIAIQYTVYNLYNTPLPLSLPLSLRLSLSLSLSLSLCLGLSLSLCLWA